MTAALLASVLALALLTVLPGPDVAVVTRVALVGGLRAATRTAWGIVSGLLVWGLVTVAGLAAVLAASATAYTVVKLVGAAYLVGLGLHALWQAGRAQPAPVDGSEVRVAIVRPYRTGLVSNVLNPKIAIFYTGLLPTLVPRGAPHTATLLGLVLVHALLSITWLGGYARVVVRAASTLQRPRVRRALDRLTGLVLVGFGLRVATSGRH